MREQQSDPPNGSAHASTINAHAQHGVAAAGDIVNSTIYVGLDADATGQLIRNAVHPVLFLTRFDVRTKQEKQDLSDVALLSAYRDDIVPLLGRESEMEGLLRWTAGERKISNISIRVLTGGAGRGKTRLALELARRLARDGWLAGFVTDDALDRFRRQGNVADWVWNARTLVVVDYAASRIEQLRDWIAELADKSGHLPLRLLLLERQANRETGWLSTVLGSGADARSRAARVLLDPADPIVVPEIDDLSLRRDIFSALACRSPGLVIPLLGADSEFDRLLGAEKWAGDPLFLMMAGLVAGTSGVSNALALGRADLANIIAQRELERIGEIAASRGIDADDDNPGFMVQHMAVLATLVQGLELSDARALALKEMQSLRSGADLSRTIKVLSDALPRQALLRDGAATIAPIQPDIIGEAAILAWLGKGGALTKRGAAPMASIRLVADTARARVVQTLVRTAQDFAAAGRDEPIRWLESLAQVPEIDLGALMEIADELPFKTLAMRELAAELALRIVDRLRKTAGNTKRPFALGQRMRQAVNKLLFKPSPISDSRANRDAILSLLAGNLNNLGIRLSNLGRREEALAASQEAVEIRRRLAHSRPDAFLPDLATSLNNLAGDLSNLGRHEEALAASQEAVEIYRRLAHSRPDAFLPDLATSISVQSDALAALHRHKEAALAAGEALRTLLPFVQRYPQAYERLARVLIADVRLYSEAAGQLPDGSLLEQATQALPPDDAND